MTCRELVERVTAYLEGALGPREVQEVTRHLEHCDGCTEYIEQIRATISVTAAIRLDAPDHEALLRKFRAKTQS
jgi:anti-sigma factor RsiW